MLIITIILSWLLSADFLVYFGNSHHQQSMWFKVTVTVNEISVTEIEIENNESINFNCNYN